MSASDFDRRWRELAQRARATPPEAPRLVDLASRARAREPEPIAWLSARASWSLAAVAAALTVWLAPLAFGEEASRARLELAALRTLPPPALPPPPGLESPSYYLAKAGDAWRELTP